MVQKTCVFDIQLTAREQSSDDTDFLPDVTFDVTNCSSGELFGGKSLMSSKMRSRRSSLSSEYVLFQKQLLQLPLVWT